ncbi:MAG TPA: hypothetical protein VES40_11500 [Ilumatobacteraceae bacterium]|nr:hypothetical protein [Ilumatobacteraceae bacterium]
MTDTARPTASTLLPAGSPSRWRTWYLLSLAGFSAYSMACGWQAQFVSYPLFRSTGATEFADYHLQYNDSIPLVVIVPGFLTFLGAIGFVWVRPRGVSRSVAVITGLGGLTALLSTVLWAIPAHDELDRIGPSSRTMDDLITANLVRSLALTATTLALGWGLACLLRLVGPGTTVTPGPASS